MTLPPLHADVLAACQAAGWQPVTYEGAGVVRGQAYRYAGIVAVLADLRLHAEWDARQPDGEWRTCLAELAVRHPDHDRADFARVYPTAWRGPHPYGHRCRVSGIYSLLRLLALPPDVIAAGIVATVGASAAR